MNSFDEPAERLAGALSRRQVLGRLGGLAGAMLIPLGLASGRGYAQSGRVVSLRAVMQQLSGGCDPSHGIKVMLPDDRPVISIGDVIRRYYRP